MGPKKTGFRQLHKRTCTFWYVRHSGREQEVYEMRRRKSPTVVIAIMTGIMASYRGHFEYFDMEVPTGVAW